MTFAVDWALKKNQLSICPPPQVADLGLGVAEQVRHPTNGRVYWRFKRKTVPELTDKNYQLLHYLRIDMVRYSRLGQPSLHVPGLELDTAAATAVPPTAGDARSARSLEEEGSNSSGVGGGTGGKTNGGLALTESEIKQEVV